MKIASFNVNGVRARMPIILRWLEQHQPDALCLQETKVQDPDFPHKPLADIGYRAAFKGQKSYNGVAILSRVEPEKLSTGFADRSEDTRLICADIGGVTIVNTYIPQGRDVNTEHFVYKLEWYDRLLHYFDARFDPDDDIVWVGDLNVAPTPLDVYDPEKLAGSVCFHPDEHNALQRMVDWGLEDVFRRHHPDEQVFTFWDYRIPNGVKRNLGWRIDHILTTRSLANASTDSWVDQEPRLLTRPSDHTPIVAEFSI